MTIEITGRASSHHDYTNVRVARELVQRFGERVAHLSIEIDALWAPNVMTAIPSATFVVRTSAFIGFS